MSEIGALRHDPIQIREVAAPSVVRLRGPLSRFAKRNLTPAGKGVASLGNGIAGLDFRAPGIGYRCDAFNPLPLGC
jgi:hypothetical protein